MNPVCLPEETAFALLKQRGLTLSSAESCTGGLIAKRITDLAGASAVFRGGVVSYTNGVKAGVLGVPEALLETYGAVSEQVAKAMAAGCRKVCGSDIAVSVTGVAGPDRDDRNNPVGTVYLGLAFGERVLCKPLALGEDHSRDYIRRMAADEAFLLVCRALTGEADHA